MLKKFFPDFFRDKHVLIERGSIPGATRLHEMRIAIQLIKTRRWYETRGNTYPHIADDMATTMTEFVREGTARIGRQSQTWVRFPGEGWRVVAAHVSLL